VAALGADAAGLTAAGLADVVPGRGGCAAGGAGAVAGGFGVSAFGAGIVDGGEGAGDCAPACAADAHGVGVARPAASTKAKPAAIRVDIEKAVWQRTRPIGLMDDKTGYSPDNRSRPAAGRLPARSPPLAPAHRSRPE
jgi:hypothetical protein